MIEIHIILQLYFHNLSSADVHVYFQGMYSVIVPSG